MTHLTLFAFLRRQTNPQPPPPAIKERQQHHSHYSRNSHEPCPIPVSAHTNLGHLTTPPRRPPELAPRPLEIEAPKQGLLPTVLRCVSLLQLIHPRPSRIPEISANSSVFRSIVGASATKTEAKNRNKEEEKERGGEEDTEGKRERERRTQRGREKGQKKNKREQELRARERERPKLFSAAPALASGFRAGPSSIMIMLPPSLPSPRPPSPRVQTPALLAPPPSDLARARRFSGSGWGAQGGFRVAQDPRAVP